MIFKTETGIGLVEDKPNLSLTIFDNSFEQVKTLSAPIKGLVSVAGERDGRYYIYGEFDDFLITKDLCIFKSPEGLQMAIPLAEGLALYEAYEEWVIVDSDGNSSVLNIGNYEPSIYARWPSSYWVKAAPDGSQKLLLGLTQICDVQLRDLQRLWQVESVLFCLMTGGRVQLLDLNGAFLKSYQIPTDYWNIFDNSIDIDVITLLGVCDGCRCFLGTLRPSMPNFRLTLFFPYCHELILLNDGSKVAASPRRYLDLCTSRWVDITGEWG